MTAPDPFAALAARWDHGHTELTDDCALCQAEYDEARAIAATMPCPCNCHGDNQ